MRFGRGPLCDSRSQLLHSSFTSVLGRTSGIVGRRAHVHRKFCRHGRYRVLRKGTHFISRRALTLSYPSNDIRALATRGFIVTYNSHPCRPASISFARPHVCSDSSVLDVRRRPHRMLVCNTKIVNYRCTSVFHNVSMGISLVGAHSHLLTFLSRRVSSSLSCRF